MKDKLDKQINEAGMIRLFEKARNVVLSNAERASSWVHILSRAPVRPSKKHGRIISVYRMLVDQKSTFTVIAALAIIVLVGGGLSLAAQDALPGDFLYPVKVNFNEKARALAAVTHETRARVHIDQASTRLAEAEELAIIGRLDNGLEQVVKKGFEEHAGEVIAGTESLRKDGDIYAAASVSSDLESTLIAHKNALSTIRSRYADSADALTPVDSSVSSNLDKASQLRAQAEEVLVSSSTNLAMVQSAAKAAGDDTANTLSAAETAVNRHDGVTTEGKSAASDIGVAKEYRSLGLSKLVSGAYGEALLLFGKADRTAEQASLEVEINDKIRQAERLSAERGVRLGTIPPMSPSLLPLSTTMATSTASSTASSIDAATTTATTTTASTSPASKQ